MTTTHNASLRVALEMYGAAKVVSSLQTIQNAARSMTGGLATSLAGLVGQLTALTGGLTMYNQLMRGMAFNQLVEESRVALASLFRLYFPQVFTSFEKALDGATGAVERLKREAIESPMDFSDLVQSFQAIIAISTKAGFSINQTIEFMIRFSQIMRTMGVPAYQFIPEARDLLTGTFNIRYSLIATQLFPSERERQEWREILSGRRTDTTVFDFLMKKMSAIGEATKYTQNLTVTLMSNIRDAWEQFMGSLTESATQAWNEALRWIFGRMEQLKGVAVFIKESFASPEAFAQNFLLVFNAAVEATKLMLNAAIEKLSGVLNSGVIGRLVQAAMFIITGLAKLLVTSLRDYVVTPLLAGLTFAGRWLLAGLKYVFETVVNSISATFQKLFYNLASHIVEALSVFAPAEFKAWMETKSGLLYIQSKTVIHEPVKFDFDAAEEWRNAMRSGAGVSDFILGGLVGYLEQSNAERAKQMGITPYGLNLYRLLGLIRGYTKSKQEELKARGEDERLNTPFPRPPNLEAMLAEARKREEEILKSIQQLTDQAAMVQSDYLLPSISKRDQTIAIYKQQLALYDELIEELTRRASAIESAVGVGGAGGEGDVQQAETLRARIDQLRLQRNKVFRERAELGPDPRSLSESFSSTLTELGDRWRGLGHQISSGFKNTFVSSVEAIKDGLTAVIMQTRSWGEALAAIGNTIRTAIVRAIVDMVVEFVMSQTIMRGAALATAAVMKALHIEQQAQNKQQLASGAAAGVGQSAAQGGWVGVLIYLGVLTAALATVMALTGGFARGGFTGAGPADEPAGVVHRGEYVFSRPAVQALGVANLERLHRDAQSGSAMRGQKASSETPLRVVIVDNRRDAQRLLRDPRFRNALVDLGADYT